MYLRIISSLLGIVFVANNCLSQRSLEAIRIEEEIKIDGNLNEDAWSKAPVATGFITFTPDPGKPSEQLSEVMVLYDDDGIYVGARLFDTEPEKILKELGTRDAGMNNADYFIVYFDTYSKSQEAFAFGLSASGVQTDAKLYYDSDDISWDAVWDSEVEITNEGWFLEMKIPYSALRFPNKAVQEWNINFHRVIRRTREESTWNPYDPNQPSLLPYFGRLYGLNNIEVPVRLSVTPYVSAYLEHYPFNNEDKSNYSSSIRGGLDLKYGISESFTLDMTLVPDFGQVQSDNYILNLSPFEVQYDEKRPFFLEGIELFTIGELFYSRRIGSQPVGYHNIDGNKYRVIDNPATTQLINAFKISGRTANGTGIGFFNAITDNTYASVTLEDSTSGTIKTQPVTNYNVLVVDRQLKNNSNISFINTNVYRHGNFEDANVTGTFFNIKNKLNTYSISGSGIISQNNLSLNEYDNTIVGFKYHLMAGKIGGKFRFNISRTVESEKYDINDLGFMLNNNNLIHNLNIGYFINEPIGKINKININSYITHEQLYKPKHFTYLRTGASAFFLHYTYLGFGFNVSAQPLTNYDFYEPRVQGRYLLIPPDIGFGGFISTDYRKKFALDMSIDLVTRPEWQQNTYMTSIRPRIRINDQLSFYPDITYSYNNNSRGFASIDNEEIIFGNRDIHTTSFSVSGSYIFNSKMGININLRHYWSNADYDRYFELQQNGELKPINYKGIDDINFNAFNIDLGFFWEFSPGSELRAVWKNEIIEQENEIIRGYFQNVNHIFGADQGNSFSIKLLYYLDYQRVKNKFFN